MTHADEFDHALVDNPGFWKRHVSFFRIALLFAVTGQLIAALFLHLAGKFGGVDFKSADPGEGAAFHILAGVFVLQLVLILVAIARIGVNFKRLAGSLAALTFGLAMVMILYVWLQCDLYGACL